MSSFPKVTKLASGRVRLVPKSFSPRPLSTPSSPKLTSPSQLTSNLSAPAAPDGKLSAVYEQINIVSYWKPPAKIQDQPGPCRPSARDANWISLDVGPQYFFFLTSSLTFFLPFFFFSLPCVLCFFKKSGGAGKKQWRRQLDNWWFSECFSLKEANSCNILVTWKSLSHSGKEWQMCMPVYIW